MKVIWNLDMTGAIPLTSIKYLRFEKCDLQYAANNNLMKYAVYAYHTIVTGQQSIIYTADTQEDCVDFINNL